LIIFDKHEIQSKFFFDRNYHIATTDTYDAYLLKTAHQHPFDLLIFRNADGIRGNRFLQEIVNARTFYSFLFSGSAQKYLTDYYILQTDSATEVGSNKLARNVASIVLHSPFLVPVFRAIGIVDAFITSPFMVQLRACCQQSDSFLAVGVWVRKLHSCLTHLNSNPDVMLGIIGREEKLVSLDWDFAGPGSKLKISNSRATVHKREEANLLINTPAATAPDTSKWLVFLVHGVLNNLSQNFSKWLPGGVYFPSKLTSGMLYALQMTDAKPDNTPMESVFGNFDSHLRLTNLKKRQETVSTSCQGAVAKGAMVKKLGELTEAELAIEVDNGKRKRPWLNKQMRDDELKRKQLRAARTEERIKSGLLKSQKKDEKTFEIQGRSSERLTDVAQIDAKMAELTTQTAKKDFLKKGLTMYGHATWQGTVVLVDGKHVKMGTLRDDLGRKYTAASHKATVGEYDVSLLLTNFKFLTQLAKGSTPLTAKDANVSGVLADDERVARDMPMLEVAELAKTDEALLKKLKGKVQNQKASDTVFLKILTTCEAGGTWLQHFDKGQNKPFWYHSVTKQAVWNKPTPATVLNTAPP
jgi:hypothetical protein